MTTPACPLRSRPLCAGVFVFTALLVSPVFAQSTAPASTAPAANAPARRAPTAAEATRAAETKKDNKDEVIELTAFEVQADSDTSYGALNSASITRFAVEMEKMPVSADIFTETFMKDIAATSVEDVITGYSAGAGYASGVDNGVGTGASNQPGDRVGNAYIQLRGMNTPAMQRDGFMPVGAFGNPGSTAVGRTDNFDLERVEVINGPQALLYGGGGAGGVINVTSKAARFSPSDKLFSRPKGSMLYRIDNYGSKRGELDFGFGNRWFATRFAFLKESTSSRRVNVGGTTDGQYGQIAFRFFQQTVPTTVRLSVSATWNKRRLATGPTLTATAADPRNGLNLHYILATHQEGANNPVTGAPYAAGAILNGGLNWGNVDSLAAGVAFQDPISNQFYSGTVDTKWNSWLTTQVAGGYDNFTERRINPGFTFFAPNSGANNTPNWAAGVTPSDSWQPARTKGGRIAALITKNFWDNRVKTQTLIGGDYIRTDFGQIGYNWYQADANWNPIVAANSTIASANSGRTALGQLRWSLANGPQLYPFADPRFDQAVWNGLNYVRMLNNQPQANLVTLANPHGVPFTSGNYIITKIFNQGFYGMNYSQWFDGKLNTLVGVRRGNYISDRLQHPSGRAQWLTIATRTNFNVGIDYSVNSWLHPYVNYSDSVEPPFLANSSDPYSDPPASSHGVGGDAGLKFNLPRLGVSGSFAWFRNSAKNALYNINSNITAEINPGGLNGGGGGSNVNVDRVTTGLELRLTASPVRNWRVRFSASTQDGKIGTAKAYDQVYNDQFYANATGQVTYRNGTIVYVNGGTTAVASTAANATPLTITAMSTPGNFYYANPDLISGRINTGAVVANILRGTGDTANLNANGPILTGATMLPISQLQLNKTLAGINTPGTIVATRVGDKTTGYPEQSVNLTNLYLFDGENFLKGLQIGGTISASWGNRRYYYYATPVTAANALTLRRTLYYGPDQWQFDLIFGYQRKFGRYQWRSSLNVNNLFNHYIISVLPNATTGYNTVTALNATWYQQPRSFQWTNSISF